MKKWIIFVYLVFLVVFAVNAKDSQCVLKGSGKFARCRILGSLDSGHTRESCESSTMSKGGNVFNYNDKTGMCLASKCKDPINNLKTVPAGFGADAWKLFVCEV